MTSATKAATIAKPVTRPKFTRFSLAHRFRPHIILVELTARHTKKAIPMSRFSFFTVVILFATGPVLAEPYDVSYYAPQSEGGAEQEGLPGPYPLRS